jgi:putative ABC transport system permease protein
VIQFLQDLRYGMRVLAKSPGLTLVIILSLAIGIGANTAVFSVADALLLKPLPYPHSDRLAILWLRSPGIGIPEDWPSPGQYLDVRQGNRSFEEMAICIGDHATLTVRDHPERIEVIRTSSTLLPMLGAKPLYGRLFTADDDASGKKMVVLLTHAIWKRLFNADPAIAGRDIVLSGNTFTVAGILGPDFLLNHEVVPDRRGNR